MDGWIGSSDWCTQIYDRWWSKSIIHAALICWVQSMCLTLMNGFVCVKMNENWKCSDTHGWVSWSWLCRWLILPIAQIFMHGLQWRLCAHKSFCWALYLGWIMSKVVMGLVTREPGASESMWLRCFPSFHSLYWPGFTGCLASFHPPTRSAYFMPGTSGLSLMSANEKRVLTIKLHSVTITLTCTNSL